MCINIHKRFVHAPTYARAGPGIDMMSNKKYYIELVRGSGAPIIDISSSRCGERVNEKFESVVLR